MLCSVNFVIDGLGVGGLVVHRCREESEPAVDELAVNPLVPVICGICGRQFRSSGGLQRLKCTEP